MNLELRRGIGDIRLGMSEADLVALLGPPKLKRKNFLRQDELMYDFLIVALSPDSHVAEISATRNAEVTYNGRKLFVDPTLWRELIMQEPSPREYAGTIVLPSLQLSLSGFHDHDPSQLSATVFAKGHWDALLPKSKPFHLQDGK